MATRTLQIVLAGDDSSASRAFKRVERDAKHMGDRLDKEGGRVRGFASITSKGMGRVGLAAGGMATAGAGAAALLAKSFVSGATAINESLSKNQVLFGKHAAAVDQFSQRTAKNFGISRQAALEATGTFGNLFTALEIGPRKAAGMSVALTKLAADMASFNNASPEEALEAIRSGLVGETEPLRKFGVSITDAALRTQALKMGLIDTVKNALTPQQKALAIQKLLFEQTTKAQGDFARTSGGLANQQRILKARLADAGAELGAKLMPAALAAVKALNSLFNSSTSGGRAMAAMGRLAAQAAGWLKDAWAVAVQAVNRFVKRNREDIDEAIRALRNFGRFVRDVINNVVLPVFRHMVPIIKGRLESIGMVLGGVVKILTGIMNGDWKRVWEGIKQIPLGIIHGIRTSLQGLWRAVRDAFKALVPRALSIAKDIGVAIVKGIVAGIKAAPGAIADAITGLIPGGGPGAPPVGRFGNLGKPVGDVIGKSLSPPNIGGFNAPTSGLQVEARQGLSFLQSNFGPLTLTSGRRSAAENAAVGGAPNSDHLTGLALDLRPGEGWTSGGIARLDRIAAWARNSPAIRWIGWRGVAGHGPGDHLHLSFADRVAGDVTGRTKGAVRGLGGKVRGVGDITQAVTAAKSVGLSGKLLETMVAIAGAESGYDAGINAAGPEDSRGLWQINVGPGANTDMLRLGNLYNPMVNARAMKTILGRQGLGAWSVYTSGKYQGYLAQARAAIAGGGGPGVGKSKKKQIDKWTGPGARKPATALEKIEYAIAMAALTDTPADDIKAADRLVRYRQSALFSAKGKGARTAAAQALRSALDDRAALNPSGDGGSGGGAGPDTSAADLAAAIKELTAAVKAQVEFGQKIQSTENFQLKKYLADVIGGQVVGYGVAGRAFTPGTGVAHAY